MFDDFEFEDKYNPWDVKSLEEFFFYCCPSCPLKNANKTYFISHALAAHPESQSAIEGLEDKTNIKMSKVYKNFVTIAVRSVLLSLIIEQTSSNML